MLEVSSCATVPHGVPLGHVRWIDVSDDPTRNYPRRSTVPPDIYINTKKKKREKEGEYTKSGADKETSGTAGTLLKFCL
jgi:hypothetical protein